MPKVENNNTRPRAGKVTRLVLNFLVDPSFHRKIVGLVDKYTGKPFRLENICLVNIHKVSAMAIIRHLHGLQAIKPTRLSTGLQNPYLCKLL